MSSNGISANPESAPPKKQTIAIVGAGITGLLAAHGLKKHGFPVAIFDRDPTVDARTRDWTILIHWAWPIMERLLPVAVLARFPEAVTTPLLKFTPEVETFRCYDARDGSTVFNNPTPGGRRITRQRLRKVLTAGLEGDIRWGKRVVSVVDGGTSGGVKLNFDDGTHYEADFVLGADGSSSAVRQMLFNDPEKAASQSSGVVITTGISQYNDATKVQAIVDKHPIASFQMGSNSVAAFGPYRADDPDDMGKWPMFWVLMWKIDPDGEGQMKSMRGKEALDFTKRYVAEHRDDFCKPFGEAIEWAPDGSPCDINVMRYWIPTPWNNFGGRVTLIGDAAHPMLPFRGQGLQMSIVDAHNYLDAMLEISKLGQTPEGIEKVMTAFEAEMIPRGAEAVKQSLTEAERALNPELIRQTLMVTRGHGRLDSKQS